MPHLDWLYLGVLWVSTWMMGDKNISSWVLKIIGSILGIVFGIYMSLWGLVFWNAFFLIPIIRGWSKWRKEDELKTKNA